MIVGRCANVTADMKRQRPGRAAELLHYLQQLRDLCQRRLISGMTFPVAQVIGREPGHGNDPVLAARMDAIRPDQELLMVTCTLARAGDL
ncbi:MAG: hypothetical protein ACK5JT_00470 [Hyphomicrobiaceae bacterium]